MKEKLMKNSREEIAIYCDEKEKCVDTTSLSLEVIGIIIEIAAGEIPGISGMSAGIVDGIAERLGRKDSRKGIKVNLEDSNVKIELFVIVEYGYNIIEVCNNLREKVRESVEDTTNLNVSDIIIHVQGVSLPQKIEE